jgi:hypothetical protein
MYDWSIQYLFILINSSILLILVNLISEQIIRGRDHMVVGFITTYAMSAYHH